jgi:transposase-like protein
VQEWKESGEILYQKMGVRSCASLHPVVEPDHRGVKRRVKPMLGFQSLENARVGIAGIELAQKISQRPYDLRRWGGTAASHPHVWQRVMAA